mmetsp:Transcript_24870/g.36496  ORF Transcript_24870/g.36496 Transcript_24870/m.36496 type:complete len:373 (-) Transcript_24870:275-1393(-)|eukprot:CAMPEP_0195519940 /NCGR_PEP_ID=MMETSP0794_2-20130614/15803_1 /TAXON_ID=515487 /ORGANISM="Stephanopyxis turris, Strain CCMP 815" /LENGTH=372 /DNA_ID=CAMNT_0040649187 /DNA_START=32 /DNA_END=1150 /DNA_ORIENTATION=+
MVVDSPNVGLAFGLVTAAGLSTAIGASVVFFPSLIKLASKRVLAGSLGLSAGVMLYVSFVEILFKSLGSFQDSGIEDGKAYCYATLCFFGGVVFMIVLDLVVHKIAGGHYNDLGNGDANEEKPEARSEAEVSPQYCIGCTENPAKDLEEWQRLAEEEKNDNQSVEPYAKKTVSPEEINQEGDVDTDVEKGAKQTPLKSDANHNAEAGSVTTSASSENLEQKRLSRMGINTAIAIGLHNFPEGLATFVATLNDPGVGAVLAIAIGIHNLPEGLCVSLPIYYATGNRYKAFGWALLSGLSEPLAAVLGWLVLANAFSDELYAVLFGLVSGMMVVISLKELLPTAHRYDPQDTVVTYSLIAGMAIMALSLVLFML